MRLVEVARFADLIEAQVVAAALRSSGMHVCLPNEYLGTANFNWHMAMGGFPVLVFETDWADAREFIIAARNTPSTMAPLTPFKSTLRFLASFVVTFATGIVTPCGSAATWGRMDREGTVPRGGDRVILRADVKPASVPTFSGRRRA